MGSPCVRESHNEIPFSHKVYGVVIEQIVRKTVSGAGSALFAASALGWKASGIELLPVGIYACQARLLASSVAVEAFQAAAAAALQINFADHYDARRAFQHIAITRGAFPPPAEEELAGYLAWCHTFIEDANVRALMLYAAFCILEEISYTRKDGQYLRWDARAGRSWGKKTLQ